jgi:HEPN domain-containing protein
MVASRKYKKPPASLDPYAMFRHAERFMEAELYLRQAKDDASWRTVLVPAVVLSAFSSELFLKSLIGLEGVPGENIHELDRLFAKLNQERQQRLIQLWIAHRPSMILHWLEFERLHGVKLPRDLPSALALCGRSFERWRYAYEPRAEDAAFYLAGLPGILRTAILELKPEWAVPAS